MNLGIFSGHLGRDAELRDANGSPVANFALGVNVGFGDKKETLWVDCSMWGERATKVAPFLRKGRPVSVSGDVSLRQFCKRDGTAGAAMALNVQRLTLQGSAGTEPAADGANGGHDWKAAEAKAKAAMPAPRQESAPADMNDDIPF